MPWIVQLSFIIIAAPFILAIFYSLISYANSNKTNSIEGIERTKVESDNSFLERIEIAEQKEQQRIRDYEFLNNNTVKTIEFEVVTSSIVDVDSKIKGLVNNLRKGGIFLPYQGMTANEIKESYYEGDRVYEISPQQPIPYMDVDIRNNYGEIVFVVRLGENPSQLFDVGHIPKFKRKDFLSDLSAYQLLPKPTLRGGKYKRLYSGWSESRGDSILKLSNEEAPYRVNLSMRCLKKDLKLPGKFGVPFEFGEKNTQNIVNELMDMILNEEAQCLKKKEETTDTLVISDNKMSLQRYVVFDLETTGLDPEVNEILQISAIKYENHTYVDSLSYLIKPIKPIVSNTAFNINHITNEMVEDAPSINEIIPIVLEFLCDEIIIGHNIRFDLSFFTVSLRRLSYPRLTNKYLDTLSLSKQYIKGVSNYRLESLNNELSLSSLLSHNALNDCVITNELFEYIMERNEESIIDANHAKKFIYRKKHK